MNALTEQPYQVVPFLVLALPLAGLGAWGLQPPAGGAALAASIAALLLALLLSTALVMLLNVATAAALNERGINTLAAPVVIVLSGNLLPLALLPDGWQAALLLQPLAGVVDIPARIYFGRLAGLDALAGLALQGFWTLLLVLLGRAFVTAGAYVRVIDTSHSLTGGEGFGNVWFRTLLGVGL